MSDQRATSVSSSFIRKSSSSPSVSVAGLPTGLSDCGLTDEDIDAVVRLSQSSPGVKANPKPVSEEDARAILGAAW